MCRSSCWWTCIAVQWCSQLLLENTMQMWSSSTVWCYWTSHLWRSQKDHFKGPIPYKFTLSRPQSFWPCVLIFICTAGLSEMIGDFYCLRSHATGRGTKLEVIGHFQFRKWGTCSRSKSFPKGDNQTSLPSADTRKQWKYQSVSSTDWHLLFCRI